MGKILGRKEELKLLEGFLGSPTPQFLAVYGRRRVGKTFLIRNFFAEQDNIIFFDVAGTQNEHLTSQITNFTNRISELFFGGVNLRTEKNWQDTFKLLTNALAQVPQDKQIVMFFDELPWMATKNGRLLQNLDYYWNQYWSKDNRIKLIICGSSASWMINKILNNKGGLHNRVTHRMLLEPFKLNESKEFLSSQGMKLNNQQVAALYMVTGGVPFYLSQFRKDLSIAQNIEQVVFKKNGLLLEEFDNLFSSLFDNPEIYIDIVRAIAQNWSGLAQEELFKKLTHSSKGGEIIKKLKALEDAGFIKSFVPFSHKKRGIYYRVVDEFTLFYLKWIEPIKKTLFAKGVTPHYWEREMTSQSWASWSGYAFEAICYKHLSEISNSLQIDPTSIPNTWRYVPPKQQQERGAQIDLLFDRPDNAITICEIKYTTEAFALTKDYVDILKRKIDVFRERTSTDKQIFVAIIAANGIKNNYYADEIVNSVITIDDFFIHHI